MSGIEIAALIITLAAGFGYINARVFKLPSAITRKYIDLFWKLIDEILNAILFMMLGLEATRLHVSAASVVGALVVIPLVLAARFISVAIPVSILRLRTKFVPHAVKILTWGGLRGGISVALALSLPVSEARDRIVALTYAVVAFSILVQGLSLRRVLRRLAR